MKIEIYKNDIEWYIASDDIWATEEETAEYLNISLEEFNKILIQNRAYTRFQNYYFTCEEDAKRAMKDLEPYLILATLTQ